MAEHNSSRARAAPAAGTLTHKFMAAVITAIVVAGLYFGRPVLLPLALAVLLSFALGPLVMLLRHLRLGNLTSVLLSLFLAVVLMSGLVFFVGAQVAGLAADLPHYQSNVAAKIRSIQGSANHNQTISRLSQTLQNLSDQITGERQEAEYGQPEPGTPSSVQQIKPIPVVIRQQSASPIDIVKNIAGPLLEPLGLIAIVIVFVGFILLQKDDLRDRFVRLAGARDMRRTTIALDEAAAHLSRYLFLQTIINAVFGIAIGIGLWLIGIPNAGLWALMAMLFRFVPYIGVPSAMLLPLALGIAVDPGWQQVVWILALYGVLEAITGQIIEPWLYGRSMGLSAVAVVVSAVFWTWMWGPVGLLVSTPLTMCCVVLARHVESLKFLDVMLGDQPALAPEESLYLRMLGHDPGDATEDAETFLRENTLADYYDEIAARALMLAQADVNRGVLDMTRQQHIRDSIRGFIRDLSGPDAQAASRARMNLPPGWRATPVLCIAGRGPLDEAAALLLIDTLAQHGIGARLIAAEEISAAQIDSLQTTGVQLACLSYLDPGTYKNARLQVRRLRKRLPDAAVFAVFWGLGMDSSRYLDAVEATECDMVTTGLGETLEQILRLARAGDAEAPAAAPPASPREVQARI